jgi:transcriptional regulator GlxA family with amidase domain
MDSRRVPRHALAVPPKPTRDPSKLTRTVEVLAYPAVQLLDVAGPLQVFASANDFMAEAGEARPYAIRLVAPSGQSIHASAGIALVADPLPPVETSVDTLIVAGGEGVDTASLDAALMDWLRNRIGRARCTASICTGAFLLAASGALDGRRAVTHWLQCAELARRFPSVRVESDPIFVRDHSVWTSAGVTAGIDLALALVEEDLGRTLALTVARYLVVFLKRPGGQAQFSEVLSLQAAEDKFGALHHWISEHLAEDLSLPVLAGQAGMSERSFSRHYAESTGLTPAHAIERLRVEGRDVCSWILAGRSSAFPSVAALDRKRQCAAASSAC